MICGGTISVFFCWILFSNLISIPWQYIWSRINLYSASFLSSEDWKNWCSYINCLLHYKKTDPNNLYDEVWFPQKKKNKNLMIMTRWLHSIRMVKYPITQFLFFLGELHNFYWLLDKHGLIVNKTKILYK
jgi:hypothetical protein